MKKALTISLVIPVYNEENYLKACLDTIAAQTVRPDRVIIVNNNSTDNSIRIAKAYPNVLVISEKNQGVAYARDTGFNAVHSDLIGRIDADTQLPARWVETILEMFTHEPKMDAISGPTGFYDLPGPGFTLWATKVIRTGLFYIGRSSNKYLFGSNMAIRTSAWQAVGHKMCHVRGNHEDNDLAIHLVGDGYDVHYSNRLTAMISVRRADATPKQAWRYAFSVFRTYKTHGIFSVHGWLAGVILLFFYPFMKILRRAYDDKQKKYSLKKFISYQSHPRPHPMN